MTIWHKFQNFAACQKREDIMGKTGRISRMIKRMAGMITHTVPSLLLLSFAVLLPSSCVKDTMEAPKFPDSINNVLLIYAAGQNSLAHYLQEDINDFCDGYLPQGNDRNILLVYEKLRYTTYSPVPPVTSYLIRYYRHSGQTVADTLLRINADKHAAEGSTLNEVLTWVRNNFHAQGGYGLLFSSHATGWLPKGYYSNPYYYDDKYETGTASAQRSQGSQADSGWVPYFRPERDPSLPPVKSIGQDYVRENGQSLSYEMNLTEFDDAIPMHLDYIFFDCCLMGGIEVAYELRDKCDRILFSPTEVIAEGFDYANMGQKLLGGSTPDLEGVCSDYYEYYKSHPRGGQYRSATVTLVDCMRLEPLADVCRSIFSTHRDALDAITPREVQGYFTADYHRFYDLYDIADHAGASDTELGALQSALDNCIIYKAATENFLTFPINVYSGLSMYLPCNGSDYLDANYRELDWNKATGLVQQES